VSLKFRVLRKAWIPELNSQDALERNQMTSNTMILVAEDEESDALLLGMALKKAGIPNPITVVRDGQEAVAYLKGDAPYNNRTKYPLPGLLLVDLNMPRMNGFGLLSWLAANPAFKYLPAVVLTSSSQVSDIEKARRLGAMDYRVKPNNYKDLGLLMKELISHWLKPTRPSASQSENIPPVAG
jgi:CheY-like chemotaxis protein